MLENPSSVVEHAKALMVIDFPVPSSLRGDYKFVNNLVTILDSSRFSLLLLSANYSGATLGKMRILRPKHGEIHLVSSIQPRIRSLVLWTLKIIRYQVEVSTHILRNRRRVRAVFFYLVPPYARVLPAVVAKSVGLRIAVGPIAPILRGVMDENSLTVSAALRLSEGLTFRLADILASDSKGAVESLRETGRFGPFEDKIRYPILPFIPPSGSNLTLDFSSRKKIIGFVGRLSKTKGGDILVEVMESVLAKREDIEFVVAGQGEYEAEVRTLVSKFGRNRIDFRGWVPHSEIPHLLNQARLLFIPSRSESGPFVLLEAMSCGTPTLSARIGIAADVIVDGENGFIYEEGDISSIARKLIGALESASLARISTRARETVETLFSRESVVANYNRIFSSLLD